jgi:hypothetical protein
MMSKKIIPDSSVVKSSIVENNGLAVKHIGQVRWVDM